MSTQQTTIQKIYEAFLKADIPTVIGYLADDVEWEYGGTHKIPWLQPRSGHAGAMAFFESLSLVDIQKFDVKAIMESNKVVLGLIDIEFTIKASGKKVIEDDEVHVWHFNDAGKISRFRHRADTLLQFEGLQ